MVYMVCNLHAEAPIYIHSPRKAYYPTKGKYDLDALVAGVKATITEWEEAVERERQAEEKLRKDQEERRRKEEEWERSWAVAASVRIPGYAMVGKTVQGEIVLGVERDGMKRTRRLRRVLRLMGEVLQVFEKVT